MAEQYGAYAIVRFAPTYYVGSFLAEAAALVRLRGAGQTAELICVLNPMSDGRVPPHWCRVKEYGSRGAHLLKRIRINLLVNTLEVVDAPFALVLAV